MCAGLRQGQMSRAAIFLILRQAVITILNIGSTVAVARWLGPEILGRFSILLLITQGVLGYFGDLGLKAALIRKRGHLEATEMSTSQTVMFGFSLLLAIVTGACLPVLFRLVRLGPENYLPAAVLLLLLVLRNFRLVPLAILERGMRFRAVSALEAGETVIYAVVLAALAYFHYGVWAFVVAMICRDIFGVTGLTAVTRPPWGRCSWRSMEHHVKFSLFYQGAAILNMTITAFPTIVLARMAGKAEVGYVAWASNLALYSLVICNALARMYLPAFSKVSHDRSALCELVEKALRVNASIAFPICAVLASLSGPIITFVFTPKWLPAQPALYAYCLAAMLTAVGTPLNELFYSLNDAAFNFWLSLCWAVLTWTLGLLAVRYYGFLGFVGFYAALQATWVLAFSHARGLREMRLWAPVSEPALFSFLLILGNVVIVRVVHLASFQSLLLLLVLEGVLCSVLLLRTLIALRLRKPAELVAAGDLG